MYILVEADWYTQKEGKHGKNYDRNKKKKIIGPNWFAMSETKQ